LETLRKSLIQRGDLKRALKEAEGALEDYDASGNKSAEAAAHGALADVRRERNEMELAISELLGKPIGSMYGIFTYICLIFMVNVGIYTIHGWYGKGYVVVVSKFCYCYPVFGGFFPF